MEKKVNINVKIKRIEKIRFNRKAPQIRVFFLYFFMTERDVLRHRASTKYQSCFLLKIGMAATMQRTQRITVISTEAR